MSFLLLVLFRVLFYISLLQITRWPPPPYWRATSSCLCNCDEHESSATAWRCAKVAVAQVGVVLAPNVAGGRLFCSLVVCATPLVRPPSDMPHNHIVYSDKYTDDKFEYRFASAPEKRKTCALPFAAVSIHRDVVPTGVTSIALVVGFGSI